MKEFLLTNVLFSVAHFLYGNKMVRNCIFLIYNFLQDYLLNRTFLCKKWFLFLVEIKRNYYKKIRAKGLWVLCTINQLWQYPLMIYLDFDKEKKIVVTGGRDRMLSRLNFENLLAGGLSSEKPIVQMNAHERLITSVKIHKINEKNYVFSSSRYEML